MKAWEFSRDLVNNVSPEKLKVADENWDLYEKLEKLEDERVKRWWKSEVAGTGIPECLIVAMIQSVENKGFYAEPAERWIEKGIQAYEKNDMGELFRVTAHIKYLTTTAEKNPSSPYWQFDEFSSWDQYLETVSFPDIVEVDDQSETYAHQIYSGWLGKLIGSGLGSALEGFTTDQIIKLYGDVRSYVRKPASLSNDITYELAFLRTFEEKGYGISALDIADEWVSSIPFALDAEDIALRSINLGYYPPESGRLNNPFTDWVGAQMRGSICGMVAPGDPKEASRLAWMDGSVSHYNNGILGEVFNAIMTSRAFVQPDIRKLVEEAVNLLPANSEYYQTISAVLTICRNSSDYMSAWRLCESLLEKYHWSHVYPNAAAEVVALWFGDGSFDETMHIIAMAGREVDCNASQIATILGIAKGEEMISDKWKLPIGDEIETYVRGMKKLSITGLAGRTVTAVKKALRY